MTNRDHMEQFISQLWANAAMFTKQAEGALVMEATRLHGMADAYAEAAMLAERVLGEVVDV